MKKQLELSEVLELIKGMPGVTAEVVGTWIWLDGDTKPYKEVIKNAGGWWSGKKRKWYFMPPGTRRFRGNSGMDYGEIKEKFGVA